MADENSFDAELNALGGAFEPSTNPAPTTGTPAGANPAPAEKVWEAGGRKWNKPEDLAKAHDSLVREFGARNKDWQELGELRKVKAEITKDPEFARYFKESVEAYQRMRAAGQSKATAGAKSDLPPEVLEKIERHDKVADQYELQMEENALMRKYKVDSDMVKRVGDYSLANGGISLEQSYKQMMFDLNQEKLAAVREKEAAQKKEISRQSGPTPSHVQPSAKGLSMKNDASWRDAAGKELGKYFTD